MRGRIGKLASLRHQWSPVPLNFFYLSLNPERTHMKSEIVLYVCTYIGPSNMISRQKRVRVKEKEVEEGEEEEDEKPPN